MSRDDLYLSGEPPDPVLYSGSLLVVERKCIRGTQ